MNDEKKDGGRRTEDEGRRTKDEGRRTEDAVSDPFVDSMEDLEPRASGLPTSDSGLLEAKVTGLTEQLQRAVAELQNMKKRFERDREDLATYAGTNILLALLPVLDQLDLAAQHLPEELASNDWATGVVHVRENLEKTFTALGVERFGAAGERYDPALHEAIGMANAPPGTIASVFESGYRYRSRILRPAKVIVGSPTPPPSI